MKEKYSMLVRMITVAIVSLGIIIITAGVISEATKPDVVSDTKTSTPKVSFADYKDFRNYVAPEVDIAQLKKEQERFNSAFFEYSQKIYSNISKYSHALNQGEIDNEAFDEYLFNSILKYDIDKRISYLKQLSSESKALLDYEKEVNENPDNKIILWQDFLDWFSKDFNNQLNSQSTEVVDEKQFLRIDMLLILMLFIIAILQFRPISPTSK
ncbi:MAG: hypothetical protein Q9M34_02880 [Sulfurimonas sp.]|nr:hypothetical protein [Sulfurimonas sp.]